MIYNQKTKSFDLYCKYEKRYQSNKYFSLFIIIYFIFSGGESQSTTIFKRSISFDRTSCTARTKRVMFFIKSWYFNLDLHYSHTAWKKAGISSENSSKESQMCLTYNLIRLKESFLVYIVFHLFFCLFTLLFENE